MKEKIKSKWVSLSTNKASNMKWKIKNNYHLAHKAIAPASATSVLFSSAFSLFVVHFP